MAARKTSKQRRQAQNRAAREARQARSVAANTPVEDRRVTPEEDSRDDRRRSRRRRGRRSREEIRAEARSVVESDDRWDADDGVEDESAGVVDADDAEATGDDGSDAVEATPVPAAAGARRGSSPVFSARHRADVAAATADRAPARTHVGVAAATGTDVAAPPVSSAGTPTSTGRSTSVGRAGSPGSAATAGKATTDRNAPRQSATASGAGGAPAKRRPSDRPPPRPLPPVFDRFGGNEPGGRWIMYAFATVLVATVVLNFIHVVPEIVENADGEQVRTGRMFTIWHFGPGAALYYLLPPVVIVGLFVFTARPWDRRRSWNFALALLAFSTFLTGLITIYMVPLGLLAWGCWQARKAALEEVDGDPRLLREVERERRIAAKEAARARRDGIAG